MEDKEFNFKYTAPTEAERKEIERIKRQYMAKTDKEQKFKRIKRLDAFVQNFSVILALILGVMGALIFGLGMSMILVWDIIVFGIIVCIIGSAPIISAYPVYLITLNKNKKQYGEEIIRLSDEILKEQ